MITQQLFKNRDSINSESCHQVASITPSGPLDQLENKSANLPADGSVFLKDELSLLSHCISEVMKEKPVLSLSPEIPTHFYLKAEKFPSFLIFK